MQRDPNDKNKIIESVKFVTNSMGGAYERGFSEALTETVNAYNKTHPESPLTGFNIEFTVDVATFQGKTIGPDKNAKSNYFMRSKKDWVAGYEDAKVSGSKELNVDEKGDPKGQATSDGAHHASFFDADSYPKSENNGDNKPTSKEQNP